MSPRGSECGARNIATSHVVCMGHIGAEIGNASIALSLIDNYGPYRENAGETICESATPHARATPPQNMSTQYGNAIFRRVTEYNVTYIT